MEAVVSLFIRSCCTIKAMFSMHRSHWYSSAAVHSRTPSDNPLELQATASHRLITLRLQCFQPLCNIHAPWHIQTPTVIKQHPKLSVLPCVLQSKNQFTELYAAV